MMYPHRNNHGAYSNLTSITPETCFRTIDRVAHTSGLFFRLWFVLVRILFKITVKRGWVGLLTGFADLSSLTILRYMSVSKTAITKTFICYKFLPFLDIHFVKLLPKVQVMILLAEVTLDIFRFLVLLIPFFGSCCKVPLVVHHTGSRFKQRIMFLGVPCLFAVFVISTYLEIH